jgi:hypothetical protein
MPALQRYITAVEETSEPKAPATHEPAHSSVSESYVAVMLFVQTAEQPLVKSEPVQFGIVAVKTLLQAADEYGGGGGTPKSAKDFARQYDAK